jgi:tRNA pseudouridine38-40 synthase
MEQTFKLVVEYDGTAYHGWQRQTSDRTIQAEIEKALAIMTRQKVALAASGRTDAGVHALGQVAHFACTTAITPVKFLKGLNSLLPADIVIISCEAVPATFHARYAARRKTYRYRILNRPVPTAVDTRFAWHLRQPLDLDAMQAAAGHLTGEHDFKAFEGTGSPRSSTVRTIFRAELTRGDADYLIFEIEGDGFLRYMVRNIVGTLVEVGRGKLTADDFKAVLASRDREQAGATAPPQGLFLVSVDYNDRQTRTTGASAAGNREGS